MTAIPLLDVSAVHTPNDRAYGQLVQDFARAYGETGFAYIGNHGIDSALVDGVFSANRTFHALPMGEKMRVALDGNHRGYIPINTSTDVNSKLAEVKKPNQSASFMMMREDHAHDPAIYLSGPNQWPDLPGFRETLVAYNAALSRLAKDLMHVAVAAAGGASDDVMRAFEQATTWLRLLHYPPVAQQDPQDLYGSAPHTDFGCLTILAQDEVGGLQVKSPKGDWLDVPYRDGTFIVNVGDMLHRMSNGRLRSTPHRVINRSGFERYSIPFFYDPNVSTVIQPLPGTGTPKFRAVNFGDFLRAELEAGYDAHKKGDTAAP